MKLNTTLGLIISLVIIILSILLIFGILFVPSLADPGFTPGIENQNPNCQRKQVECTTDDDCKICTDNEEMKCIPLVRNKDQSVTYGPTKSYCLPVKPEQDCNKKNGGIWSWTGWSDTNRMEWDCLCTYPQIAGNSGCTNLNPNVCKGGAWSYDATTANVAPTSKNCKCPNNTQLLVTTPSDIPICVPNNKFLCDGKTMCESMYSNSTFI